ncbi:MAG: right-handed parallel beta-helix repeat-containing protein, partial [Planctomycetota bacterium]
MRFLLVILTLLIIPAFGHSATIQVPADFPTISLAINAAVNGDVILVAPGTYTENISFSGKAITVTSTSGASLTVIDGSKVNSTVLFSNSELLSSRLDGFTITNGDSLEGGGIRCISASPTIANCIIAENNATFGGGMFISGASPLVTHCIFYDNTSITSGGGMRNFFASPTVTHCRFIKNSSTKGAGMDNEAGTPVVTNCIFAGNWAEGNAGALYNSGNNTNLMNCTLSDNSARFNGGAMENASASPTITNCIIYGNSPDEIYNSGTGSSPSVAFSNVQGGYIGLNNIDADPVFASTIYGDLHLQFTSPCRDTGTAAGAPVSDYEDDVRTNPDMGADEFEHHFYCMGQFYHYGTFAPDAMIHAKIIGIPGTVPLGLFLSATLRPSPLHHMWGDFFLGSPFFLIGPLGTIPATGIKSIMSAVPSSPPGPYD